MPLPTGHWDHSSGPRRLRPRERWLIGGVLGVVAAGVVAVVIALASHQHKSRNHCIDVSAATAIGGSELYRCGSQARALCTTPTPTGRSKDFLAFRRALADVEANAKLLRDRQSAVEIQLLAEPAGSWPEAAAKARYVLNLYAAELAPDDTHHRDLVAAVVADFTRLSGES